MTSNDEMREREASDAPVWYDSVGASAWANGYNAALRVARVERDQQANLVKVIEDQFALVGAAVDRVHAYLGIGGDDAVIPVSEMRRYLSSVGLGPSTPKAGA